MPGGRGGDVSGDAGDRLDPADLATRVAAMRRSYRSRALHESDLLPDWHSQFRAWLAEAVDSDAFPEPTAMVVATASPDGRPSVRTVLLKRYDERGLVFFTNYDSRKGRQLAANPRLSCVFPWYAMERQVIVDGDVERVGRDESEHYFHSRPHGSQIAASISEQSRVVADRGALEAERDRLAARYPDDTTVPLPDFWGGYRIRPSSVEFWQGREDRLHDRLRFRRTDDGPWTIERLAP
jgi:pyridoxamine 5'-phosphate oxidase